MISTKKTRFNLKNTDVFQYSDLLVIPVLTWEEFTDDEKDSIMENFQVVLTAGVINYFEREYENNQSEPA